jgi:hypothetical protein
MRHPDQIKQYLKEDEFKVYKLIWQRFVASQITPAVFDQTTVDIDAKSGAETFWFRVTGSILKFDGFLKVYEESKEGKDEEDEELKHKLPPLEAGQKLTLRSLNPEQHFTEPPPRYNEASLVKELEERGIGRPSTYAAILSTIQERQYVQKLGGKFTSRRSACGDRSAGGKFPRHFDVQYTLGLEEGLDENRRRKRRLDRRSPTFTRNLKGTFAMRRSTWKTSSALWRSRRTKVRSMRISVSDQVGQTRLVLCMQFVRQGKSPRAHVYQRKSDQFARSRFGRYTGDHTRRILRELRERDGLEARALRAVHGVHGVSGLQDDAASRSREESAGHSAG